ncbi:hypothetical protein [Kitasatospora sp. CB01950]|uniref:hypothetical protein n=1 Tax=Kitasatospora sp. CB01950 TaxID=1703930 RepID=UPI000939C570|nr:hypothetical protein [Kitasatospora sp. CB01950]OKJ15614.1 hypothetical protein AMK19_04820 [Kitasatospora sp. CB01950]
MGLFKDTPPREHPEFTQLRFMAAGTPSWWKRNRHKVVGTAGLLIGFWLAGHHDTAAPAVPATPAAPAAPAAGSCTPTGR